MPEHTPAVVAEVPGAGGVLEASFGVRGRRLEVALDASLAGAQQWFLGRGVAPAGGAGSAAAWYSFVAKGGDVVVVLAEVRRPCGIALEGGEVAPVAAAALRSALSQVHPSLGSAVLSVRAGADHVDSRAPSGIDERP